MKGKGVKEGSKPLNTHFAAFHSYHNSIYDNSTLSLFNTFIGTETDLFAGLRACVCLEGFYRTHMFEPCHKCGQGGLKCQDDYASLKASYWWEWRNETHIHRYREFIRNLLKSSPALDEDDVQYPYQLPTPHKCPIEEACKGGLDSPCENGYEGPLCAVCRSGYQKQLQRCQKCPSKKWIAVQLSIIATIVLIIIAILAWTSKRKKKMGQEHSIIDALLSKLKIAIGFYQVTYGLMEAFSYIKWPNSLQVIGKYSEILQLNILQMAPVHCLSPGLHVDAFGDLFAIMAINAAVIGFSGVGYSVRKAIILRKRNLEDEEQSQQVLQTKELVLRNLFFFLYVTYLNTCAKTATVLPLACREICRDKKEEFCFKYLKADYSIRCHESKYNNLVIAAYISTAYILALPAATFIALWRKRRKMLATRESRMSGDIASNSELVSGLRFLFQNYKSRSWYWELVEMSRKVIVTSGLILVGQESRSYIGLAWVIAGMYGVVFAWIRPIQDVFENRLMTASLAITVVNLGIGAVSRIPAENLPSPSTSDQYTDTVVFNILVLGANTLVIGLLACKTYNDNLCERISFTDGF